MKQMLDEVDDEDYDDGVPPPPPPPPPPPLSNHGDYEEYDDFLAMEESSYLDDAAAEAPAAPQPAPVCRDITLSAWDCEEDSEADSEAEGGAEAEAEPAQQGDPSSTGTVADRLMRQDEARREKLERARQQQHLHAQAGFAPSINKRSQNIKRRESVEDSLMQRSVAAQQRRREAQLQREQAERAPKTPTINKHSRALARGVESLPSRMAKGGALSEGGGRGGVTHSHHAADSAKTQQLKKALEQRELAELRDKPTINRKSQLLGGVRGVEKQVPPGTHSFCYQNSSSERLLNLPTCPPA